MALTPKQARFVAEYLIDLNATQAAIRAGYSKKTAGRIGGENLQKLEIQSALQKSMKRREERTEITQDKVLEELARIAFANGTDFARVTTMEVSDTVVDEETGCFKQVARIRQLVELEDTDGLPPEKRAAISGIEETKHGIKVSSYDKVRALELLGKHLGMFDGKGAQTQGEENNLLQAIVDSSGEDVDTDDLPEVQ